MTTVPQTRSFAQFIQTVEDGTLHADLTEALKELNAEMNNHAQDHGGAKCAGKLTLTLDFKLDHGVFEIASDFTTKLPKQKRMKSIFWSTPENFFTPQNPRQMTMFGGPVRDVGFDSEPSEVKAI